MCNEVSQEQSINIILLHLLESDTFGSPCEANIVLKRSNGYDPTVAAQPANAPLIYDRYGLKWMWSSALIHKQADMAYESQTRLER